MNTLFGTDGIRGAAATSHYLAAPFLHRLGVALVEWAKTKQHTSPIFVIGSDTRSSSHDILYALCYGIMKSGGVCFNAGILPSPALQHMVSTQSHYYHYGIMITASHNPATDNGIKIMSKNGKLLSADEEIIIEFIRHVPAFTQCPSNLTIPPIPGHHAQGYMTHLATQFPANMLQGMHIILDCAHGATYRIAPLIFQGCGARVTVIGNTPNGTNINENCGSTAPAQLKETVINLKADIGFAFDGDGDRILAVTRTGEIIAGDGILALISTHPRFADQKTLVGTLLTNSGLSLWLAAHHKKLVRSSLGDAAVERIMRAHNAELGGEPSGHIIIRSHLPSADGIFAALYAAHTARLTKNMSFKTFTPLAQSIINVPTRTIQSLTAEPFASIIQAHEQAFLPGRSIVRYSGTEPVLRIMTEHWDAKIADEASEKLAQKLLPYLSDLGA